MSFLILPALSMAAASSSSASISAAISAAWSEGRSSTPLVSWFVCQMSTAKPPPTTPQRVNSVRISVKSPGAELACKYPTTSGVKASPPFCAAVATPYAVPSCFSATTRAMAGHSAPAKTMNTIPRQNMENAGGAEAMLTYVTVRTAEHPTRHWLRMPTLSITSPNTGVPSAAAKNKIDITFPARCWASSRGRSAKAVSTKKADAMLLNGRIAEYKNTQSPQRYQNCRRRDSAPSRPDSALVGASGRPMASPWIRSRATERMLLAQLPKQSKVPNQKASPAPYREAIHGERISLITDPPRAKDRFTPSANATSFPLNHRSSRQLCATCMDSPPRPKTIRPAIIRGQLDAAAPSETIACPRTTQKPRAQIKDR
mmetsp:Transcript_43348/g.114342  ORF Transcript_43348/g.114342 Transcript_43348/m.114342 type:complete len:372 (-) Transcript_43348:303-1418(-)